MEADHSVAAFINDHALLDAVEASMGRKYHLRIS
jgi:hypothetical protein